MAKTKIWLIFDSGDSVIGYSLDEQKARETAEFVGGYIGEVWPVDGCFTQFRANKTIGVMTINVSKTKTLKEPKFYYCKQTQTGFGRTAQEAIDLLLTHRSEEFQ